MLPALTLALVLMSGDAPGSATTDEQVRALVDEFVAGYSTFHPHKAVALGFHDFDGQLADFGRDRLAQEHDRLRQFQKRLAAVDADQLSSAARMELRMLEVGVRTEVFDFEGLDAYRRNPMVYPQAINLNIYLSRNFAPLADRVRSIIAIERHTPRLFAAARENLQSTLPRQLVETAVKVTNGLAAFIENDLPKGVAELKDEKLLAELKSASATAVRELREFVHWLETERLPKADHRFALGRDTFARMLRDLEVVHQTPEAILELGLRELRKEQAIFAATAKQIDPTKPPIDVFIAIQEDHPTAASLIPDTARNLEAIRKFVVDRKVLSMPSEHRATVAETPSFRRATSFASMDSPGPFETRSTEAYYYVTPVDPAWTAAQKNEWLTAFNYYTTDVVSIHEAYPGHYVQHLHLNASSAGKAAKIFSSYAFVEGWAHYTEQMLLDEGFPAGGDKLKTAKYRLAQSDEALLRLCRLCVAIKMHCDDMTVDEATKFFQENCYYFEQPARQEAIRGAHDPGYLFYTLGKLMILKLRRDWQQQEGPAYSLQRFHDELLRHGAPPLPLLRQVMLKDRRAWDAVLE
jgi:uncharacterized protein (DUF885 family)